MMAEYRIEDLFEVLGPRLANDGREAVLDDVEARVEEEIDEIAQVGNVHFAAEK
jgi:hypothetical protein